MEKKQFQAESQRLLDLMIHSIYTHKEIFLREIISNASDALDKLCYKALTEPDIGLSRGDLFIEIKRDPKARTITVSDNGIGMTREEMEKNLGTIARSGSLDFKKDMTAVNDENGAPIDVIGQFGVGFYSAFMVSSLVTVTSRAYGADEAWRWESSGTDGYTIEPSKKEAVGTEIIMRIKEDADEEDYSSFLREYTIVSLIKKYSDYIRYPIRMHRERSRAKEGGEEGERETYYETETLNSMIPIWQKPASQVEEGDYESFYQEKFFDYQKPLCTLSVNAEGAVSYKALLFVPAKASYDYYTKDYQKGLQLYASGVLIMDKCADLLPEHFKFVRGVVDSPDLSLNISRELLQHDRQLKVIANNINRKICGELSRLRDDEREKYEEFFGQFGLQLKYGVVSDFGMKKDELKDFLLFPSSHGDKPTTLAEYVSRMPEDQTAIYYATGDSVSFIRSLPQAELLREKGYEILYFTQEIDEFIAQALREYESKELKSVNRDDLNLTSDEEKKTVEQQKEDHKDLLTFIGETIGSELKEAVISTKLRNQPVCLTAGGAVSFEMEKYLQSVQPDAGAKAERILELNASHPVFEKLSALYTSDPDRAKDYVKILYHQAKLMAGLTLDNPSEFGELVFSFML